MAKKKIEEKSENIVVDKNLDEVIIEPKVEDDENTLKENEENVIIEEPEIKAKPSKMVKIKLKKEHKCHIGGEWYVFEKGKQYNVPNEVKEILSTNDLLIPV